MRKFKKITASLFAAIIAFSVFQAVQLTVSAAEVESNNSVSAEFGDYTYKITSDSTAEITKYSGNAEAITIPDKINGYSVTSIGERAFMECLSLKFPTELLT